MLIAERTTMRADDKSLSSPPDHARLGHVRSLDGIRGIAVLAVLGHNLKIPWLEGGFFGVDIFFALSGFLITTLLIEEHLEHGAISLRRFFARRFLRLYPPLVLLVLFSALSSLTRPEVEPARVGLVVTSTLLYFSNWVVIADSDAWMGGMGHTWSLAVEMHFYLLWSVTLAIISRVWGIRLKPILTLALSVAIASALWRIAVWTGSLEPNRPYAGTDTRLDAIFLGVAAALYRFEIFRKAGGTTLASGPRWAIRTFEVLFAGVIAWLITQTPNLSPIAFLGGFGLAGGVTALIILTSLLSPHSWLAGPLQSRVLVWFGEISYSLYLWHLPVKKFLTPERLSRFGLGDWFVATLCAIVSIALAAASYYGVERAFLALRKKRRAYVP